MSPVGHAAAAPPIAHAMGGAVGSAMAMLLFYPLERARIDLQAQASRVSSDRPQVSSADGRDVDGNSSDGSPTSSAIDGNDDDDLCISGLQADLLTSTNVQMNNVSDLAQRQQQPEEDEQRPGDDQLPPLVPEDDNSLQMPSQGSVFSWDEVTNINQTSTVSSDPMQQDEPLSNSSSRHHDSHGHHHQQQQEDPSCDDTNPSDDSACASSTQDDATKKQGLLQALHRLSSNGQLYQGAGPIIATLATSQFVFFYLHALIKAMLFVADRKQQRSSAIASLITSCLAGIGNVLLTNPLWVVNIAIVTGQTETNNLLRELIHMVQQKGLQHMWNGTSASLLLVSNPIIQFFCYEQLKNRRLAARAMMATAKAMSSNGGTSLTPIEAFTLGATAKGIATILTYPLQLAQTVLRLDKSTHTSYDGTLDCLIQLYRNGGLRSLFTGMRAKLLQTVLTAAFTFLTYEQILTVVHKAMQNRALS